MLITLVKDLNIDFHDITHHSLEIVPIVITLSQGEINRDIYEKNYIFSVNVIFS